MGFVEHLHGNIKVVDVNDGDWAHPESAYSAIIFGAVSNALILNASGEVSVLKGADSLRKDARQVTKWARIPWSIMVGNHTRI